MGPGIWQILGKEYSLGEGGEAAWEGGPAKRPGNSARTNAERKAGEDGLLGKVKLNIPNSNLQRRWKSVSYKAPSVNSYDFCLPGEFVFPQRLFG